MIKYIIDEDNGRVIAILEKTRDDVVNKIDKMLAGTNFHYMNEKCLMPSSFKAVVTCDPNDDFDVEVGKQIAKKRIMERYYNSFDKRVEFFVKDANNICSEFLRYQNKNS